MVLGTILMCILSFKGRQVGDDLIAEPQTQ